MDFSVQLNLSKNQRKQKEGQVLVSCQRTERAIEHEGDQDSNYKWCEWNNPYRLSKEASEELEIEGRAETIKATALLRPARILRKVLYIFFLTS